jgi:hypothetical protein
MTRRFGLALGTAAATGTLGLLVLTGCGVTGADAANGLTADEQALTSTGIQVTGASDVTPSPSASGETNDGKTDARSRAERRRRYLRRNTLHGQITVKTKDGTKTVAVQRGTVTAVSATSLSVKSSDGFTETWVLNSGTKVRADGKAGSASALRTGEELGVAGGMAGNTSTARLVVVPKTGS